MCWTSDYILTTGNKFLKNPTINICTYFPIEKSDLAQGIVYII